MKIESGEVDLYAILQVAPTAHQAVVQGAYRALARILHPDQAADDHGAMAMVNRAYAVLRDPQRRNAYDAARAQYAAAQRDGRPPSVTAHERRHEGPPVSNRHPGGTVLPHGRYAGWTLEQLVARDPDYLRWLSRHTSGLRYRGRIDELLSRSRPSNGSPHRGTRQAWTR